MDFKIKNNTSSTMVFNEVLKEVVKLNLNVIAFDFKRPWGGFIVIDKNKAESFARIFFHKSIFLYSKMRPH